ncbi:Poly(A) RNA polymerase protein 1 [Nakaseomyces bracarensis]|uniref:polynucleotide adenylyltransferase n=1 Tax=Nakaseomyces bracarensis TaxID=273131 RepID=A0ABR4NT99_9SACH
MSEVKEAMTEAKEVPIVEISSDSEGFDEYDGHNDNPVPELHGRIDKNDDFIAFSESSEDEQKKEVEEEKAKEEAKAQEEEREITTDYPWTIGRDYSKERELADWLNYEIADFIAYISPSKEEIEMRNRTIGRVRDAIQELWPDADLHVFGSYATDLYLPGSDIDCVVNSKEGDKQTRNNLYKLANFLKKKEIATDIEVVAKARVPIIKFVEVESRTHLDISFERLNGLEAAKLIRDWLKSTPGLRELVLVVKQFLHSRRLNNVHSGGLGGFSIICLVYAFLHLHPRIISAEIDPLENLGVLLIEFFELYGKNFGYDDVAIGVSNGTPFYMSKRSWRSLEQNRGSFNLAIQDPGDENNNISRGSFNLRDIKKAFAGAFDLLTNRCFELNTMSFKERFGKSILGNAVKYRGKKRDFNDERGLVQNKAIAENETYHKKKRGIIMHGEVEQTSNKRTREEDNNANTKRQKQEETDEEDDYHP